MEVNRLLKQYDQMATVMKQFKKMGPMGMFKMMKQMKGMMGGNMPDLGSLGSMGGLGGSNPFAGMGKNPFGSSMPDMNSPEIQELMKKFPKKTGRRQPFSNSFPALPKKVFLNVKNRKAQKQTFIPPLFPKRNILNLKATASLENFADAR